jgi:hypothetical protein
MNFAHDPLVAGRADVGAFRDVHADDFGIGPQGHAGHRGEKQNAKRCLSHALKYNSPWCHMNLDPRIDDLYRLPLNEFTAARNALAKTLGGEEAKRVRALAKPTLVPWALNQLFWKARPTYERLLKSGESLRKAQIAALEGRGGEIRRASEAHRKALADSVREAVRLAEAEGSHPGADDLARMLEALSLAATHPEQPGRLTELVRPAGFEALAGVPVAQPKESVPVAHAKEKPAVAAGSRSTRATEDTGAREAAASREREAAAARRREAEGRVTAAALALERAKAAEDAARDAFERSQETRRTAEATLAAARRAAHE